MKASGPMLARSFALLAVLLLVSACVSPFGVTSSIYSCAEVNEKAVKHINWTKVPVVNVRIRHDEFSPMVIRLRQGWPYVFRIRNRDDEGHAFKAYEFFKNVAIVQSSIEGEVEDNPCISALWVGPRKTAELRLVASVDGYYEFEDLPFFALTGFYDGPQGVIIIEERKSRI
ncbi:MAG: hypothetical protein HN719_05825 [Alphaproteobacteria bacterium]|nr:hypothetical protein [Alphaproteobacteria bacterium]